MSSQAAAPALCIPTWRVGFSMAAQCFFPLFLLLGMAGILVGTLTGNNAASGVLCQFAMVCFPGSFACELLAVAPFGTTPGRQHRGLVTWLAWIGALVSLALAAMPAGPGWWWLPAYAAARIGYSLCSGWSWVPMWPRSARRTRLALEQGLWPVAKGAADVA